MKKYLKTKMKEIVEIFGDLYKTKFPENYRTFIILTNFIFIFGF